MKVLFYSAKDFEEPYLEKANSHHEEIAFTNKALGLSSAAMAKGFDVVSIFTGDDASADVLDELDKNGVHFIAIRAAGYDNVDLNKANELGITVANVPAYSPYAIAEHAVALLLAINRKLITADRQVHQHNFTTGKLVGFDLNGKTGGIIGTGQIGSVLVKILHGFGCRVLGHDIREDQKLKENYGLEYMNLPTLCKQADIISLHTSLTPETRYLINKELVGQMKPGVILINTGRGACVNTADIIEGLEKGTIGFYGADVYENERGIFFYDYSAKELNDPLLKKLLSMPNVLITPHQAFATTEALTNIADTTYDSVFCWKNNRPSKTELTRWKADLETTGFSEYEEL